MSDIIFSLRTLVFHYILGKIYLVDVVFNVGLSNVSRLSVLDQIRD